MVRPILDDELLSTLTPPPSRDPGTQLLSMLQVCYQPKDYETPLYIHWGQTVNIQTRASMLHTIPTTPVIQIKGTRDYNIPSVIYKVLCSLLPSAERGSRRSIDYWQRGCLNVPP
jgi:hypothetical protein